MRLTNRDLKQIDHDYLASLSPEQLLNLSGKMLDDLRDARDRLNQTPQNSSRPSGSYAPWEQATFSDKEKESDAPDETAEEATPPKEKGKQATGKEQKGQRKPGKQPGSKGVGRRVELAVTGEVVHQPPECAACGQPFAGQPFAANVPFQSTTGLYVLDIEQIEQGLQVTHVKHLYGQRLCPCGHVTESQPGRCADEPEWSVALTEWHLVGPLLCSLIICLSLRMRLSRPRIKEFLQDWLSISLSTGCINQCITEGGRAVAPLEDELVAEIQASNLLHADETGWKESGRTLWLWVLRTATVTLYLIGSRSWTVIADVIEAFGGWLMSDGYGQYRHYGKRLRCLAHIVRKARGLVESSHPEAAQFGQKVLECLGRFIQGIYAARGDPHLDLMEKFAPDLSQLQELSAAHRDHTHDKTRKLARELLNDWEAIWRVLAHPTLPITNNVAERALRHWVIARKISYGTRTAEGSRAYALLASVIDTCRQRHISPWPYLAQVIAARRQGNAAPSIPQPVK